MIRLLLALLVCAGPMSGAHAQRKATLLVSVTHDGGTTHFWWRCDGAMIAPAVERMAQLIEHKKLTLIRGCKGHEKQIHPSYRHAPLQDHEIMNLSNALDAKMAIVGNLKVSKLDPIAELGLQHTAATLAVVVYDTQNERRLGNLTMGAHGFSRGIENAHTLARELLITRLLDKLPALISAPKKKPKKRLVVEVLELPKLDELNKLRDALLALEAVTQVHVRNVTKTGGRLEVKPLSAKDAVVVLLQGLPYPARIDQNL